MLRKSSIAQLLFSLLMIIVSGCAPNDAGAPPPEAAPALPIPTSTEEVIPTITDTPTLAATATSAPIMLTFAKDAFCRNGPSTQYFDVGSFTAGDTAQADGRNDADPRWWYMLKPSGEHCWVSDSTVEPNPAAETLPIQLPEKSLPITPPDLWVDRICKKGGFAVTLNWTPSSSADGYIVYLNGEQQEDIKKETQRSYVIKLPMNEPVSYGMEAYNSVGYGEPIIIEDPGCP